MKARRDGVTCCQIFCAIGFLVCYFTTPAFNSFISNPLVAYSIMLAFGVAQLSARLTDNSDAQDNSLRKRIAILDVAVYTAFVGIVIAHAKACVGSDNWLLNYGGFALPTSLALWLHVRHRLSAIWATISHYAISIGWALCLGFIYRQYHNSTFINPKGHHFTPMSDGIEYASQMLEIGVVTSSMYFVVTTIATLTVHCFKTRNTSKVSAIEGAG